MAWAFPFNGATRPVKQGEEPGMLMKNKQLSEEWKRRFGVLQKNQVFEIKSVIYFYCRLSESGKLIAKMKV